MTGAPSDVAPGGSPDDYPRPGDPLTVSVAGLGTQRNKVVATPTR